ncbi:hypothetical protein Rhopal_001462-T1 [Rhodotorula paludigena]|uniref:Nitrogen permease regulator 3 n=1 Tax=Rhodotorula paludigena TaxID=86838 RepID=A0AAV5GFU6_9BASI|nr:hypothetical protein Rhopal_001462-T1 [Rhodotorula paludigena]
MASLLAVVLVAKSSLGAQLVYSYPPAPRPVPRTWKPVYPSARRQRALYHSYASSSSESDTSSSSDDEDEDGRPGTDAKQYLGFPDNVLASLLSPSRELCDQPFELVVDGLSFVGHPVWLGDDEGPRERPGEIKEDSEEGAEDPESEGGDGEDEEYRGRSRRPRYTDTESISIEPGAGIPSVERDRTIGPPTSRAPSAPPRPLLVNDRDEASPSPSRTDNMAQSHSSASTLHPGSSFASSQHSHNSLGTSNRLVSFNFLCVIDTPPDSHLSSHLEGFYKDVILPVTANIKALEKRDLWLGKEAAKLRRAKEGAVDKDESYEEFLHTLPARSVLAGALSQLYTSLKADQLAEMHLGPLPVQVLLRGELPVEDEIELRERDKFLLSDQPGHDASPAGRRDRSMSPGGQPFVKSRPPPLFSRMRRRPPVHFQPWETLLLLEDARVLQRDVLEGTLLWRLLEICRPTLSFAEYVTLLDLDPEGHVLEDVVDHLVHWKKARVIDLISLKGSYAISSTYKPASVYLNALVWLLRHDLVVKQRTYLRVVASEAVKRATLQNWTGLQSGISLATTTSGGGIDASNLSTSASEHSFLSHISAGGSDSGIDAASGRRSRQGSQGDFGMSGSPRDSSLSTSARSATMSARFPPRVRGGGGSQSGSGTGRRKGYSTATYSSHSERLDETSVAPTVIVEPGRPTMLERRWLSEIVRDKDQALAEKFERIVRMLDGRYHLDEIRFRAQLSRKHLTQVISAFDEHLIKFTHG